MRSLHTQDSGITMAAWSGIRMDTRKKRLMTRIKDCKESARARLISRRGVAGGMAGGVAGSLLKLAISRSVLAGAQSEIASSVASPLSAPEAAPALMPEIAANPVRVVAPPPEVVNAPSTIPSASEAAIASPAPVAAQSAAEIQAAKLAAYRAEFPETAATPFTPEQTTMSISNSAKWNDLVAKNGGKDLGSAILRFANNWGTLMEEKIAGGQPLTEEIANSTASLADTDGISGAMYQMGRNALYSTWQYGAQLETLLGKGF